MLPFGGAIACGVETWPLPMVCHGAGARVRSRAVSHPLLLLLGLDPGAPHLEEALTHPSFANESGAGVDNQRLEFLGDAVLELYCSEELWRRFPDANEGELTRLRARAVNASALARWAREHDVAGVLRLGKGAAANGLASSRNVLADAVEALIAATYLDAGPDAARRACRLIVEAGLAMEGSANGDAKTALQERAQSCRLGLPKYEVIDSGGPAHETWFRVSVRVGDHVTAHGEGRSKREAESNAAEVALSSTEWPEEGDES